MREIREEKKTVRNLNPFRKTQNSTLSNTKKVNSKKSTQRSLRKNKNPDVCDINTNKSINADLQIYTYIYTHTNQSQSELTTKKAKNLKYV